MTFVSKYDCTVHSNETVSPVCTPTAVFVNVVPLIVNATPGTSEYKVDVIADPDANTTFTLVYESDAVTTLEIETE